MENPSYSYWNEKEAATLSSSENIKILDVDRFVQRWIRDINRTLDRRPRSSLVNFREIFSFTCVSPYTPAISLSWSYYTERKNIFKIFSLTQFHVLLHTIFLFYLSPGTSRVDHTLSSSCCTIFTHSMGIHSRHDQL